MTPARPLRRDYPGRHEVPALIAGSILLLLAGLSMPLLEVEKMWLWQNDYSVLTGVVDLAAQNELILAGVIFFFSVVFPMAKLVSLWMVWFMPLTTPRRAGVLVWLERLGRWSMLDVFIVAIMIVLIKMKPLADISPRPGVYVFSAAILLSMLTALYVKRLSDGAPREPISERRPQSNGERPSRSSAPFPG